MSHAKHSQQYKERLWVLLHGDQVQRFIFSFVTILLKTLYSRCHIFLSATAQVTFVQPSLYRFNDFWFSHYLCLFKYYSWRHLKSFCLTKKSFETQQSTIPFIFSLQSFKQSDLLINQSLSILICSWCLTACKAHQSTIFYLLSDIFYITTKVALNTVKIKYHFVRITC